MNSGIIIIDLDGTLIEGNSFTMFVKYCVRAFPRLAPAILTTVMLRKMRLISHFKAKHLIMRTVSPHLTVQKLHPFLETLFQRIRPYFSKLLSRACCDTYLATAAPTEYAVPLGKMAGFGLVCATDCGSGKECRGEEKVHQLETAGVVFSRDTHVYTDHRDDLPLMEANRRGVNHLVNPDAATILATKMCGIACDIIPG